MNEPHPNATALTNLGNVRRGKGQQDGTSVCCRQAIALDPKYARANYSLGGASRFAGPPPPASGEVQLSRFATSCNVETGQGWARSFEKNLSRAVNVQLAFPCKEMWTPP
jgi:hypothetical protein